MVKSAGKPERRPLPPWNHKYEEFIQKFPDTMTPRPAQEETFRRLADGFKKGKRFALVEMSTGGGKSPVAKTAADVVAREGGAFMITAQRALQDQYEHDFPPPQMELLKGRANYSCTHPDATPGMHAGKAVCHQRKKSILTDCIDESAAAWGETDGNGEPKGLLMAAVKLKLPACAHLCPYWEQLQKCNDHHLALFNFSSFLFQKRLDRFQHRALLLLDEGHNIEQEIMKFVSVELTEWTLDIINVKIDREISSQESFVLWLREKEIQQKIDTALGDLDEEGNSVDEELREVEKDALTDLKGKLELFMSYLEKAEWVLETLDYDSYGQTRKKIKARPLFARDFAQELLFQHADRVIIFSATILNVPLWARNLGIDPNEIEHIEIGSDFAPENRPIHIETCGNMGRKHFNPPGHQNPTKPHFIAKVKQLMERHHNHRGIIHCHSFELSNVLRNEIADPRFLFQDQFNGDKKVMMAAHAKKPNSVIVAPAMAEGFDFKDDLARFQIIAKVPWPSLGDKIIKERASRDDSYYGWLTALKLVQSYGRIVRSKEDWGYTYIVDSGFGFFFSKHGRMIPGWVKEAISRYAPKPPIRQEEI